MAVSNIAKFNWEKIVSKVENADVKRSINMLRAKANELASAQSKYGKAPEVVDFAVYKNKLRFTSSAVESLEKVYKNKKLPTFTAEVPSFELKKREMLLAAAENVAKAANAELSTLNHSIEEFEKHRITKETRFNDLAQRFPALANEVEEEIKNHEWIETK